MAHSTAAATATTGEINYFFQDENGKIHKVLKQAEIKQETIGAANVYHTGAAAATTTAINTNLGAYNQMNTTTNQPHFVRLPNNYNLQTADNTTYTVIAPQTSGGSGSILQQQQAINTIKYEPHDTTIAKSNKERYAKYTQNGNTKMKLKLHNTSSSSSSTNASSVQRKRKPEKAGKGLRHFSMKVCEKVKEKGCTTYNEVADELVAEELKNNAIDSANCDQKNIRRRVYDALNVLMAMQIISKDKKEIRWIGLPTNSAEGAIQCSAVEKENEEKRERIEEKHRQLRELISQMVSFKSLVARNKESEDQGNIPTANSSIQLPFIIVNTHKTTKINCSVTNDKSEYIFKFADQFEMHDDAEVLKRMGLLYGLDKGQCSTEDIERAKTLVPRNFEKYIEAYGKGKGLACDSDDDDIPTYLELTAADTQDSYTHAGMLDNDNDDVADDNDVKRHEYIDEDDLLDQSDID